MLIGLTGKYCAGKNYIAAMLEKKGLPVLDVDKLGYKALEIEKESIFTRFGSDLRLPDGSLDRRLLGKRVFGNPKKLATLESIVHPVANRLTEEWIEGQRGAGEGTETCQSYVINAALLHRSSVFKKLDRIIIVKAPFFTRLLRARRRDKLPWGAILRRFASQKGFDSYYLPVNDWTVNAEIYIVKNSQFWGQSSKLEHQIDTFLERLR